MSGTATPNKILIRTELEPGDLGYIIHLHGLLYRTEQNFGIGFEVYVAKGLAEFYLQYDPKKDRVWIAEMEGRIIGFLALVHRPEETAQLRYFLLLPEYRGQGLGKRLMDLFMSWADSAGYKHLYLWTTNEQQTAIALYQRYGFQLTEEKVSETFGKRLSEQKYEKRLV
ncbi:MAG: GNAT family N-acetyltransferase [Bacteroidetes bacterium]|nr:GNAT family N-acetyltransferase [Bacteroidota bacterium]